MVKETGEKEKESVLLVLGRGMPSFVSSKTLDSYSNFIALLIPVLVALEYPRDVCAVCIPVSTFVVLLFLGLELSQYSRRVQYVLDKGVFILVFCL